MSASWMTGLPPDDGARAGRGTRDGPPASLHLFRDHDNGEGRVKRSRTRWLTPPAALASVVAWTGALAPASARGRSCLGSGLGRPGSSLTPVTLVSL